MPAIGVDHVQFSVPDLGQGTALLTERGWTLQFEEPNFARQARPYFRGVDKSMAFLKRGPAAIELIDGTDRRGSGCWSALFSGRLPGEPVPEAQAAGDAQADTVELDVAELGGACLCRDRPAESLELERVFLSSLVPEASAELLESLGFRRQAGDGQGAIHMAFPSSIVGMPLAITVVPGAGPREDVYVDDLGLCLIALLSKDLAQDVQELRARGVRTTDVFEYLINGRRISNAIVYGPGGEMLELIQIGSASA